MIALLWAAVGIGGRVVCIGFGVGRITLGFLLIQALPCQILGLGTGGTIFIDGPWSIGSV